MAAFEIYQFPCLSDNYGVLLHDPATGLTASIDAPEAAAINQALALKDWTLSHILVTHHHHDHVGGNLELKKKWACKIVGNTHDADQIPGLDVHLEPGKPFAFAGHEADILDLPGHATGHIGYHFKKDGIAFLGDTLFPLGCGRVFEGTKAEMWSSMEQIRALPRETVIYCGHEYTAANAKFAVTVDPANADLKARVEEIMALRENGEATVPSTLDMELKTNPFLRADDQAIRSHLAMAQADDVEVFTEIRTQKDNF